MRLASSLLCSTLAALVLPLEARPPGGGCSALPAVSAVGSGSAGAFGAPVLAGLGVPDIDTPGSFSFQVSGGVPGAPGVLVLQRREQPLYSRTYQTTVYTGANGVVVPFVLDGQGQATVAPLAISHPLSELCGMDLIGQVAVFDFTAPGGAAWSNGLRFRFGSTP